MTKSSPVIFFGNEQLASGLKDEQTPIFDALIENGYNIAAVVLRPDQPKGRSKTPVQALIKTKALEHNIHVLQPQKLAELIPELESYSNPVGILAAYGRIIPASILDLFEPIGIINVHPSLLPKYRGPSPIEATILNGDEVAGVSIMRLSTGMDEGPVFAQRQVALSGHKTKTDLVHSLSRAGADLLVDILPDIISGTLKPKQQSIDGVSYTTLLTKQDGILDPLTDNAYAIERKIRAYQNYPKTKLTFNNTDVIITSAKVTSEILSDELILKCANNTYLQVTQLIAPSGKMMSGRDFLRGYKV